MAGEAPGYLLSSTTYSVMSTDSGVLTVPPGLPELLVESASLPCTHGFCLAKFRTRSPFCLFRSSCTAHLTHAPVCYHFPFR